MPKIISLIDGKNEQLQNPKPIDFLENDFDVKSTTEFKLREEYIDSDTQNRDQLINSMRHLYKDYSKHRGVEISTERTQFLEDIVKQTLIKAKKPELAEKIRIVILNRGLEITAAAGPDGTIFLSQNTINTMENLDLIMGVIFHEVSHIENKDYKKDTSTRFTQEIMADLKLTTDYLDLAGFNTLGLDKAFKKLETRSSGTGKSSDYQELAQRSLAIKTQHFLEHHLNDTKKLTELPEMLKGVVKPSNLEILELSAGVESKENIKKIIENLSKENLSSITRSEKFELIADEYFEVITKRLREIPIQEDQIFAYLFCHQPTIMKDIYINVQTPEQLVAISERLNELLGIPKNNKLLEIGRILFDSKYMPNEFDYFLDVIKTYIGPQEKGIPLNDVSLVRVLENYLKYHNENNVSSLDTDIKRQIYNIITKYSFIKLGNSEDEITRFLTSIKESTSIYSLFKFDEDLLQVSLTTREMYFGRTKLTTGLSSGKNFENAFRKVFNVSKVEISESETLYTEELVQNLCSEILNSTSSEAKEKFTILLSNLFEFFKKKNVEDITRSKLISIILEAIDGLPFNKREYLDPTGNNPFNLCIHEFILHGNDFWNHIPNNFSEVQMERVKNYSTFNLKLITLCKLYSNDSEEFYNQLKQAMVDSNLDLSQLNHLQMLRIIGPLISVNSNSGIERTSLHAFGASQSSIYSFIEYSIGNRFRYSSGVRISNIDKLEKLPFVRQFLNQKNESIGNLNSIYSIQEALNKLTDKYIKSLKELYGFDFMLKDPFNEDLSVNIFFKEIREAYLKLVENLEINIENMSDFYTLTKSILPENITTKEILKGILRQYITSDASFDNKIEFFKKNIGDFNYNDLVLLSEQIQSDPNKPGLFWNQWTILEESLSEIISKFESGEKSSENMRKNDQYASSILGKFNITTSADGSIENSTDQSTAIARTWIYSSLMSSLSLVKDEGGDSVAVSYNKESGLYSIPSKSREYFKSISDIFRTLKGLTLGERMYMVEKSLISEMGLLSTDEKRSELAETIKKSLNLSDSFLAELAETLTLGAKPGTENRDVFTALAANLLGNSLFQSLNTENINIDAIDAELNKADQYNFLKGKVNRDDLVRIFNSSTKEISAFGAQYFHPNSEIITPITQASDDQYDRVMFNLSQRYIKREEFRMPDTESTGISKNLEILFRGAESTILGTRALQITRQMRRFENPEIDRRMAMSFDANPGLDRFRFLRSLSSTAKKDPELLNFLRNNLISIDRKLGGGSMATTYKAIIASETRPGETEDAAIRALVPGAELQIKNIRDSILSALYEMESRPRKNGESRREFENIQRNIKLAISVITLASEWCIADINDEVYEESDDIFRSGTMRLFNNVSAVDRFVAPERIYTSLRNWVRVEGLANGVSVREFLDSDNNSPELKAEVVRQVILFNRFQYAQRPKSETQVIYVQSDPSIGNYLVEIVEGKPKLHVLDRGLMIPMSTKRLDMMEYLIKGKKIEFLNSFLDEIIDYNLENNEKYKLMSIGNKKLLKTKLVSTIFPKIAQAYLFGNAKSMLDIVTSVNDVLIDFDLKLPWELQLPIKNIVGMELLKNRYISTKV